MNENPGQTASRPGQSGSVLPLPKDEAYSSPLDPGIAHVVELMRSAGIETFESCDGGDGHAYPEPTVRFHGDRSEGFRALAVVLQHGLRIGDLRRVWPIVEGEPTGPWWELTVYPQSHQGPSV